MKTLIFFLIIISSNLAISQYFHLVDLESNNYPSMKARFWAFDINGNQILNIDSTNIQIIENGQKREVSNLQCIQPNFSLLLSSVLVVDISNTMQNGLLENAKIVANSWINGLPDLSECALTSFNQKSYLNQDFTNNKELLINSLNSLSQSGPKNYEAAFNDPNTGALTVSQKGKNKKIIILITNGASNILENDEIIEEAINQNCIIYCITLGFFIPKKIEELVEKTGGIWFENISSENEVKHISNVILMHALENDPCNLEWNSKSICSNNPIDLELNLMKEEMKIETNYTHPSFLKDKINFEPNTLYFPNPQIGTTISKTITIKSNELEINNSNIKSSNPAFKISPTNFTLPPNQEMNLTVSYTAYDSIHNYSTFSFENEFCTQNYFVKGGYFSKYQKLQLIHPNGGEFLVVGSDTLIVWGGISPFDTISIDYSLDNGVSWTNLTKEATGLSYNWNNIPRIEIDNCLIKISQLTNNNNLKDSIITLKGHTGNVYDIAFSPDGKRIITGSGDNYATMWDIESGESIFSPATFFNDVTGVSFSPDGNSIALVGHVYAGIVYDANTSARKFTLVGHNGLFTKVEFSPLDNKIITANLDSTVKIWDSNNGNLLSTLKGHTWAVWDVAVSKDGKTIATVSGDGTAKIWDALTGNTLRTFKDNNFIFNSICFSPDGLTVATANSDNKARIWDIQNGTLLQIFEGHTKNVSAADFSPDGTMLVTSSYDRTSKIWDVQSGNLLKSFIGHNRELYNVKFSPDGSKIATTSLDETAKVWKVFDLNPQEDLSDTTFSIVIPSADAVDIDMGKEIVGFYKDSIINNFVLNLGNYPFRVDSIYFSGINAESFKLISGIPKYIVEPNSSYFAEFRFSPINLGLHEAVITIITQSDTLIKKIIGEGVDPKIGVIPEFIDFGIVEIGNEKTINQIEVIRNLTNKDLEIINVIQIGPDLEQFYILEGGGSFVLEAYGEHKMNLQFKPKYVGKTSNQLGFVYNSLTSPAIVQLFGTGVKGKIELENYSGYPGDDIIVDVQLKNVIPSGLDEFTPNFKLIVEVNGTLLYPFSGKKIDQNGSIFSYEIEGEVGSSDVIIELPMKVGLGNAETCEINIIKLEFYDENDSLFDYDIELDSSTFTLLGVCYEGGIRLIDPYSTPMNLSIQPNPTSSQLSVDFELFELGGAELMIYDIQGNKVFNSQVNSEPGHVNLDLDLSNIPNGMYNLILQTQNIMATQQLMILR